MEKEKKELKELQAGLSSLEKDLTGLKGRLAALTASPDITPLESEYREAIALHAKGKLSQVELDKKREAYHRSNGELKDHEMAVDTIEADIREVDNSLQRQRAMIREKEAELFRLVRDQILKTVDVKQIEKIGLAYVAHKSSGGGGFIGEFFEDKFLKVSDLDLAQKSTEIKDKYFP